MSTRRNSLKVNDLKKAAAAIKDDHGTLYDSGRFLISYLPLQLSQESILDNF